MAAEGAQRAASSNAVTCAAVSRAVGSKARGLQRSASSGCRGVLVVADLVALMVTFLGV